MRDQLRDLIAAKLHADGCGCDGPEGDYFRNLADSVMELFPDVQASGVYHRNGWTLPADTFPQFREATHRYFMARTAPEPIAAEPGDPS